MPTSTSRFILISRGCEMTTYAYCWQSGLIEFGTEVPEGAMPMVSVDDQAVRDLLQATARLAHDNETLLVPGVPEALDEEAKLDALDRFMQWLRRRGWPTGLRLWMDL